MWHVLVVVENSCDSELYILWSCEIEQVQKLGGMLAEMCLAFSLPRRNYGVATTICYTYKG